MKKNEKMTIEALKELFERDLNKLKSEIENYENESTMWKVENSIRNSGGNLCLHIIGNLKNYIGNGLGKIGYIRQREFEFSGKFISKNDLLKEIDETIQIVIQGLNKITDEQLNEKFPMIIWENQTGMAYTIIHLHSHLNYHLGQINYHRRILDVAK